MATRIILSRRYFALGTHYISYSRYVLWINPKHTECLRSGTKMFQVINLFLKCAFAAVVLFIPIYLFVGIALAPFFWYAAPINASRAYLCTHKTCSSCNGTISSNTKHRLKTWNYVTSSNRYIFSWGHAYKNDQATW